MMDEIDDILSLLENLLPWVYWYVFHRDVILS